jgi:hypothetical protein
MIVFRVHLSIQTTSPPGTPIPIDNKKSGLQQLLSLTENRAFSYLSSRKYRKEITVIMFKRLKALYQQYKPYVRVDLVMYAVLILLIIMYFIISTVVG